MLIIIVSWAIYSIFGGKQEEAASDPYAELAEQRVHEQEFVHRTRDLGSRRHRRED